MDNNRQPASRRTSSDRSGGSQDRVTRQSDERASRPSDSRNSRSGQSKSTKQKKPNSGFRIIIRILIIMLIIGCFAVAGALIGAYLGIVSSSEELNPMAVTPKIFSSKIVVDSTGETYANLEGKENREYVTIDTLPDYVGHAFVAIEDERFYTHNGVDLKATVRSVVKTLTSESTQGGSTITQQLIKNNRGLMSNTWKTKIQEQYLAIQYEKDMLEIYGSKPEYKDKILEIYMNMINLGGDYNGVQTASRHYFNKDASELTISEAAVLACITQAPTYYDPLLNPDNNAEKQKVVLAYMLEQGYITDKEYLEAKNDDVYSRISDFNVSMGNGSKDTYYTDQVKMEVAKDLAEKYKISKQEAYNQLFNAGLEIRIPIDLEIQEIVDKEYMDDANFPTAGYKIQVTYLLDFKSKSENKVKHYEEVTFVKKKEDIPAFEESVKAKYMQPGDEIIATATYPVVQPQSSFIVIDNETGYVTAITGGRGEKLADLGLNRATGTVRQPGSTFKIVASYAPGIDNGTFTVGSVFDDVQYKVGETEFNNWYVKQQFPFRGLSTVREAIRDSMNIIALKAMDAVGVNTSFDYLENFGYTTLVESRTESDGRVVSDKNLSTALGGITDGVSNLENTAAFATIANGGEYRKPIFYTQVYDHDGELILDNTKNESRTVIKPTTAWLLTHAMQDVITSGTGTTIRFRNLSMPISGKTGTTSDSHDLWFEGFTPYYTAGVWLGYDKPETIADGVYHKDLWRKIMEQVHIQKGLTSKPFEQPDGIVTAKVCKESGQLEGEFCSLDPRGSTVVTEYYEKGTEPTETCTVHVSVRIDSVTGQLATNSCPEGQVVQTVMIVRPSGEIADEKVADAKYQRDGLEECVVHTGSNTETGEISLDGLKEGVDYFIDPITGDIVFADGTIIKNPAGQGAVDLPTDLPTETIIPTFSPITTSTPKPTATATPTPTPTPPINPIPTPTNPPLINIPDFKEN